jgi:hypothetical protein
MSDNFMQRKDTDADAATTATKRLGQISKQLQTGQEYAADNKQKEKLNLPPAPMGSSKEEISSLPAQSTTTQINAFMKTFPQSQPVSVKPPEIYQMSLEERKKTTNWFAPPANALPLSSEHSSTVEGEFEDIDDVKLPTMDKFDPETYYFDVVKDYESMEPVEEKSSQPEVKKENNEPKFLSIPGSKL